VNHSSEVSAVKTRYTAKTSPAVGAAQFGGPMGVLVTASQVFKH